MSCLSTDNGRNVKIKLEFWTELAIWSRILAESSHHHWSKLENYRWWQMSFLKASENSNFKINHPEKLWRIWTGIVNSIKRPQAGLHWKILQISRWLRDHKYLLSKFIFCKQSQERKHCLPPPYRYTIHHPKYQRHQVCFSQPEMISDTYKTNLYFVKISTESQFWIKPPQLQHCLPPPSPRLSLPWSSPWGEADLDFWLTVFFWQISIILFGNFNSKRKK